MATGTLGGSARDYHTRQTAFLVGQLSGVVGGNFNLQTAQVKIGTIPAGSLILRIYEGTAVVFNGVTTDTISIGTAAGGAQLFASAAAGQRTLGVTAITPIVAASGPLLADTDIWVNNTGTGGAGTTGTATIVVEYATAPTN